MMRFILLVAGLAAYQVASAELVFSGGSQQYFEVLQDAFSRAERAQIEDLPWVRDLNSSSSTIRCVVVGRGEEGSSNSRPNELVPALIGRFSYTIPGEPPNGPLFPGKPEQTIISILPDALVGFGESEVISDELAVRLLERYKLSLPLVSVDEDGDLRAASYSLNAFYRQNAQVVSIFRKSGSELYWNSTRRSQGNELIHESYGYCYRY